MANTRTALYGDGTPAVPFYAHIYAATLAAHTTSGDVMTADAAGILTVDGVSPSAGDTVMYAPVAANAESGIYEVTTVGSGLVAFVLTRIAALKVGLLIGSAVTVRVLLGTRYANTLWRLIGAVTPGAAITVGTTTLVPGACEDKMPLASFTDTSATPGSATANTASGRSAFAAAGSAAPTITNNLVSAASIIHAQLEGPADATATAILFVTPGAGSFTVTAFGAATATTRFTWQILGQRV